MQTICVCHWKDELIKPLTEYNEEKIQTKIVFLRDDFFKQQIQGVA
jgi:hypothetical protein